MRNKPELLAPAGGMASLIAAVQSGANAVYLGAGDFNARRSADNFSEDQLREAVGYCHARGVRVHVTLNTMIREDELPAMARTIEAVAAANADAVLVQDFGVARAVRAIAPELALHASTQMAVHNRAGAAFLAQNGFARAVLAREMSLEEIRSCAGLGIELEVFVHGALCVSCSGQCLFSGLVGGRSGNRGRCAQPCRMRYRMDGIEGYLLSTRDLCALDALDDLRAAGVDSFKIEGRLKRPEYVTVVTAAYRAAIDNPAAPRDLEPLRQIFNRGGFTRGYLYGVDDAELMFRARPNHLGVPVGTAVRDGMLRLDADIDPQDALVLRAGSADGECLARRVERQRGKPPASGSAANAPARSAQAVRAAAPNARGASVHLASAQPDRSAARGALLSERGDRLDLPDRPVQLSGAAGSFAACPGARRGDQLIRLVSEAQMRQAQALVSGERQTFPVHARLTLRVGRPAVLELSDGEHRAEAVGSVVEAARSRELDRDRVAAQLGKTGGTPYRLTGVAFDADDGAFIPVAELNALRRDALERLTRARMAPLDARAHDAPVPLREAPPPPRAAVFPERPAVRAQSGDPARLCRALALGADGAIFDPRDVRPEALAAAEERLPGVFSLAVPEVLPQRSLEALQRWAVRLAARIDRVYLSNVAHFALDWPGARVADFSLNAANALAVAQLREWGCEAYTPSVELSAAQIAALEGARTAADDPDAQRLERWASRGIPRELIVHGRLPLMRLRHCPWRAVHGASGRHADCRRCDGCAPAERVDAKALIDRTGASFPLRRLATPDGCIVRLLNSVPLMTLRRSHRLPRAEGWRLLLDDAGDADAAVRLYLCAARGEDFRSLSDWSLLDAMPSTTGHYFRGVE